MPVIRMQSNLALAIFSFFASFLCKIEKQRNRFNEERSLWKVIDYSASATIHSDEFLPSKPL